MDELRIALTISGAVSLGAYEGGALAALLVTIKKLGELIPGQVRLDVLAGASAGSMTGILTAKALLTEADPVELMYRVWVSAASLSLMEGHDFQAPLSVAKAQEVAYQLLGDSCPTGPGAPQQTPIKLQLALGALRGLDYRFGRLGAPPLQATTYLDWYPLDFGPNDDAEKYRKAIDPALASGAHAFAFPPKGLLRKSDRAVYENNGIVNFPCSDYLWYTDGGTIDNQPLGRALRMSKELDAGQDVNRLHLLIIPDPSFAPRPRELDWADPNAQPLWLQTLVRAGKMAIAQSLYNDLRQAEKTNSRVVWKEGLVTLLAKYLDQNGASELAEYISMIERERKTDLGARDEEPPPPPDPEAPIDELVRRAIDAATGLQERNRVAVDAVSPQLLGAETHEEVRQRLAGAFLGHFGGFFDERFRRSDFGLGYESMLAWLDDPTRGLRARKVASKHVDDAIAAAEGRLDRRWTSQGGATVLRLGPGGWFQLARLGLRTLRLTTHDVRDWAIQQRSRGKTNPPASTPRPPGE